MGSGLAFAMNAYWFSASSQESFLGYFETLMLTQAVMTVIVFILFNFLIKDKPATPPSAVAEVPYEALDFG